MGGGAKPRRRRPHLMPAIGGFSPASYRRSDQQPDRQTDWPLLEDAFAAFVKAVGKTGWPQ